MAGDEADLVAEGEAVGRGRDPEPAVLGRGALVGLRPPGPAAPVWARAVLGREPGAPRRRRIRGETREGERRLARVDPAAVAAHVDLDMHREGHPGLAGRRFEVGDLRRVVDADADP